MTLRSLLLAAASTLLLASHASAASAAAIKPLVFGGDEAPRGTSLFMVGLRKDKSGPNKCGGSLIARQFVLTAAHCALNTAYTYASVGSHFSNGTSEGEQIRIASRVAHPEYNASTFANDLAVLRLERPVGCSSIRPLKLADKSLYEDPGLWTIVRGWGYQENGKFSTVLKQVELQVRDTLECQELLERVDPESPYTVDESMLCAGGREGEDSCGGDSGGPLTVWKDYSEIQVGVVSWGLSCGVEDMPGVYARVSAAREFIDANSIGHSWET